MSHVDGTDTANAGMPSAVLAGDSVQTFLSRTSRQLAESLDYESTLSAIAGMAFPFAGSWCIIDIIDSDGTMRRVDVMHPDPAMQACARRLADGWPPQRRDIQQVVSGSDTSTDVIEFMPRVTDELLTSMATSAVNLDDLRALDLGSVLVVPLVARGHTLGTITFLTSASRHAYSDRDAAAAQDLAARCAMTLDNARLFRDAENARARTAELNQQLIITSIRMQELAEEAREANQTKSRFLATMSHEIRTPINAIVGYTDLLGLELSGPMSEDQKKYVQRIQDSSRHLIGLVDDVLDLAKVEAGRMFLKHDALGADTSIREALTLVGPQADAAGIELDYTCEDDSVFYCGDGDRVRQILVILLTNALKFTERGGRVHIRCGTEAGSVEDAELTTAGGPYVYMAVEDNGIGISEQDARHVFDAFVQADQHNTRKQGGSGLGLAIGLELARRMSGNLTLRSVLGVGSCFTVWLPEASTPV